MTDEEINKRIKEISAEMLKLDNEARQIRDKCNHKPKSNDKYVVHCEVCECYLGRFCEKSPNLACDYDDNVCRWCGRYDDYLD